MSPTDAASLQSWFQSVDTDRSGEISASELAQLKINNRPLGPDMAKRLIAVFDKDRSGSISFQECTALNQFLVSLQNGFYGQDRNKPALPASEVARALQVAGFSLGPNVIQGLTLKYDTTRRGALTWDEFLAAASQLAYTRSVFEWSDTDHDGKATFDLEHFAYATMYF